MLRCWGEQRGQEGGEDSVDSRVRADNFARFGPQVIGRTMFEQERALVLVVRFGHKFAGRTGTLDPSSVSCRSSWLGRYSRRSPAGYRGRMTSRPARPPLGLFDNPVRVFSLDELAETVRKLERERPGRTVEELSGAVFTELAISHP